MYVKQGRSTLSMIREAGIDRPRMHMRSRRATGTHEPTCQPLWIVSLQVLSYVMLFELDSIHICPILLVQSCLENNRKSNFYIANQGIVLQSLLLPITSLQDEAVRHSTLTCLLLQALTSGERSATATTVAELSPLSLLLHSAASSLKISFVLVFEPPLTT